MQSNDIKDINGAQMRAARALLNISAQTLADMASIGVATIRRAETGDGAANMSAVVVKSIITALADAGVELIAENGGGVGVRLIKNTSDNS